MNNKIKLIRHHFDKQKNKFYALFLRNGEYEVIFLHAKTKRCVQHFFYKDERKANNYFEKITGQRQKEGSKTNEL